jgi:hypothetical protein
VDLDVFYAGIMFVLNSLHQLYIGTEIAIKDVKSNRIELNFRELSPAFGRLSWLVVKEAGPCDRASGSLRENAGELGEF